MLNKDLDYEFVYNTNKTLEEQNVSKEAKTIIAILYRDYWATDEQRKKILLKEKYDKEIIEQKSREKYNPEDIFKNRNVEIATSSNSGKEINKLPAEIKESLFTKVAKFLKKLFTR